MREGVDNGRGKVWVKTLQRRERATQPPRHSEARLPERGTRQLTYSGQVGWLKCWLAWSDGHVAPLGEADGSKGLEETYDETNRRTEKRLTCGLLGSG